MDRADKKMLDKNLPDFVNLVNPIQLMPYLPCLSMFSKEEIEAYQINRGRNYGAQKLYEHLIKKPTAFAELLAALRNHHVGHNELADLLDPQGSLSTESHSKHEARVTPTSGVGQVLPATGSSTADEGSACAAMDTGPMRQTVSTRAQVACTLNTSWSQLSARVKTVIKKADLGDSLQSEDLAGIIDLSNQEVNEIKHKLRPGESLTVAIIEYWCQIKPPVTLEHILNAFNDLHRIDILKELEDITGVRYQALSDDAPGGTETALLGQRDEGIYQREQTVGSREGSTESPGLRDEVTHQRQPLICSAEGGKETRQPLNNSRDVHQSQNIQVPEWNSNGPTIAKPCSDRSKFIENAHNNIDIHVETPNYKTPPTYTEARNQTLKFHNVRVNSDFAKVEKVNGDTSLEIDGEQVRYFEGYKAQNILQRDVENVAKSKSVERSASNDAVSKSQWQSNITEVRGEIQQQNNFDSDSSRSDNENPSFTNVSDPVTEYKFGQVYEKADSYSLKKENSMKTVFDYVSRSVSSKLDQKNTQETNEALNTVSDSGQEAGVPVLNSRSKLEEEMDFAKSDFPCQPGKIEHTAEPSSAPSASSADPLEDFEHRKFENLLCNSNPSEILRLGDQSSAWTTCGESAVFARTPTQPVILDESPNYSLEDARAAQPKIPSYTRELESIRNKGAKQLPGKFEGTFVTSSQADEDESLHFSFDDVNNLPAGGDILNTNETGYNALDQQQAQADIKEDNNALDQQQAQADIKEDNKHGNDSRSAFNSETLRRGMITVLKTCMIAKNDSMLL